MGSDTTGVACVKSGACAECPRVPPRKASIVRGQHKQTGGGSALSRRCAPPPPRLGSGSRQWPTQPLSKNKCAGSRPINNRNCLSIRRPIKKNTRGKRTNRSLSTEPTDCLSQGLRTQLCRRSAHQRGKPRSALHPRVRARASRGGVPHWSAYLSGCPQAPQQQTKPCPSRLASTVRAQTSNKF